MTGQTRPLIAVAHQSIGDPEYVRSLFGDRAELRYGPLTTDTEAEELTAGADAVIVTLQPLRAERIARIAPSVRVIGRAGVGLDTIDLEAANHRRLAVVHEPSYATAEVANHAAALTLGIARRILPAARMMEEGWGSATDLPTVPDLSTKTIGVIGFGAIGRAYAERMRPFFGAVQAYDPQVPAEAITEWGAIAAPSLDALLATSDFVSLHIPLLPQTRGIIGAAQLASMRPGSMIVNVSRGGLIDEGALADALASGHLGGAGIDVFEQEPLPAESALRGAPNLLMTPHIAWLSADAADRMAGWTVDDVLAVLADERPPHGRLAVGADWVAV